MKYSYDVYGPRFIVKAPEGTTVSKGGIHLLTQEQDLIPVLCEVTSAEESSPRIKTGDKVLVNKHAINLVDRCIDKEERLYIVNEADVFAIVQYRQETDTDEPELVEGASS